MDPIEQLEIAYANRQEVVLSGAFLLAVLSRFRELIEAKNELVRENAAANREIEWHVQTQRDHRC